MCMPVSDCEDLDPRIRRTRQLLQGALRGLMQTRSFEEISVQDITEAATVNRATFYDHYTDKFALLDALIAGGFHSLLRERNIEYELNCPSVVAAIIVAACDYQVLMHKGNSSCKGSSPFEPMVDAAIIGAIRRVLSKDMEMLAIPPSLTTEMMATAASCTIYGASREWFKAPNRPPVDEIVPQILALVYPMLQLAIPSGSAPESTRTLANSAAGTVRK
jgi:AcrR family transcriptional regulator